MRRATAETPQTVASRRQIRGVKVGDYLHSDSDLFRVEQLGGDGHALIEDCRTGALIDVPTGEIAALTPVEPA